MTDTRAKVSFDSIDSVREFVNAADKCDFDIDISYNSYMVDAKSFLGIIGIGLQRALQVRCHGNDERFNKVLQRFAIA